MSRKASVSTPRMPQSHANKAHTDILRLKINQLDPFKLLSRTFHYQRGMSHIQSEKKIPIYSRRGTRRALSFARAVRATLKAEEEHATMQINEIEEYLGILREQKATIQSKVAEADYQIGLVQDVLHTGGIPEIPLSDDEDTFGPSSSGPFSFTTHTDTGGSDKKPMMCFDSGVPVTRPGDILGRYSSERCGTPDSGSSSLIDYESIQGEPDTEILSKVD